MTIEPSRSSYRQLAEVLREGIRNGEYARGATLPSETELAAHFDVSRPTVNRAITILRNEGLLRVERGRGTFVHEIPPIQWASTTRYTKENREAGGVARGAFDSELARLGLISRSELVFVGPDSPPERVGEALRLGQGERTLVRKRRMYASDVPVQLATSYVPWSIAEGTQLEQQDTGRGGTYSRLAELGHPVARFTEAVEVRTPTPEEEKFLRLAEEQQVFNVFHVALTAADTPVEVTVHVMPTHQWVLNYEWPAEG